MIEKWVDIPFQPIVPVLEPIVDPQKAEFGQFSMRQREWFLRRDIDPETGLVRCQFVGTINGRKSIQCPIDEVSAGGRKFLHAHHIIPEGFWRSWYGEKKLGEEA